MPLRQPKRKGSASKGKKGPRLIQTSDTDDRGFDGEGETSIANADNTPGPEVDPDDPNLTIPLARYNAMLAVLRNTLYMYVNSARLALDNFC
jgi:hypothetical protein